MQLAIGLALHHLCCCDSLSSLASMFYSSSVLANYPVSACRTRTAVSLGGTQGGTNVAGVPTGRSLARRPLVAAGMVAHSGDNLQCLPLALLSPPAGFIQRTYAYTTSHKIPSRGVVTRHKKDSHAQANAQQANFPVML